METHEKWILGIIINSMVLSLIELGVSFGDGALGGYSLWMAPVGAILTEILHIVTLPVWKKTAKKRQGTPKPSFLYSVTLCTLTCLLAVYWVVTAILTLILAGAATYFESAGGAFAEGSFGLILSVLMWAEFGIIVHYRKIFLKKVKRAKQAGQEQGYGQGQGQGQGQGYGQAANTNYGNPVDPRQGGAGAYGAQYGQPPVPPYPHPQPQPQPQPQPPINTVNPMNQVVNPPYPVYNPNPINQQQPYTVVSYQPPPMAQVNLMQKDAGK